MSQNVTKKYILGPYWNWLVKLFPTTVAPNAITLSGLCLVFLNFLTLLYYNPTLSCGVKPLHISKPGGSWDPLFMPFDAQGQIGFRGWLEWLGLSDPLSPSYKNTCAPPWLFYTWGVGLFMYQSLDAIDGKQARRTGTSGPLGELFDHGCDALNTTLGVILTASALNLGLSWWTVISLVATNANFYLTTWEEFHTGNLYLSAFSGPVEGILLIVGVFFITGALGGPQFWDQGILTILGLKNSSVLQSIPFHIKDLPVNDLFLCFSSVGLLFNIFAATKNVNASLPSATRTASSILAPLSRLIPYLVHTTAMVLWLQAKKEDILSTTLLLPFMIFWGLSFAHHVGLLILAHLTSSRFPALYKHPLLILSVLGAVDANAKRLGMSEDGWVQKAGQHSTVKGAVGVCLVISLVVYAHFVYEVVGDICQFYDMNCLTIKHKKPEGMSDAEKMKLPAQSPAAKALALKQKKKE